MRTPDDIARHCLRYERDEGRIRIYTRTDQGFSLLASFPDVPAQRKGFETAFKAIKGALEFAARRTYRDIGHTLEVLAARPDVGEWEPGFRAIGEKIIQVLDEPAGDFDNDFLEHFVDPDAAARALIKALLKKSGGTATMTSDDLKKAADHHLFFTTKEKAFSLALGKVCTDPKCRHRGGGLATGEETPS